MSDFGQPAKNTWKKITLRDSQAFKRERMFSAINGSKLTPANKNIRKPKPNWRHKHLKKFIASPLSSQIVMCTNHRPDFNAEEVASVEKDRR